MYQFIPVAIETLGAMGPKTRDFVRALGKRISRQSGDPREPMYLMQRLSVHGCTAGKLCLNYGLLIVSHFFHLS